MYLYVCSVAQSMWLNCECSCAAYPPPNIVLRLRGNCPNKLTPETIHTLQGKKLPELVNRKTTISAKFVHNFNPD